MKYCFAIIGIALLTGCAAKVTPFNAAGGRPGFVVSCRNEDRGWAECYEAAAKACDGRYAMANPSENRATSTAMRWDSLSARNKFI